MTPTPKTQALAAIAASVLALAGTAQARTATTQQVSIVNPQGQRIPATLFAPVVRERGPAVVMMPACSGAASGAYDAWAERLAQAGYVALLVDSDTPRGAGKRCDQAVAGARERAADAEGAYRYLTDHGLAAADRVGLVGWSEGASGALAALDASHAGGGATAFKAAVVFQPDCRLDDAFGGVARSTWKPYASVRIVQGPSDLRRRDWSCIRRIARAQQLGAPSVNLIALREVGQRFDAAVARSGAAAEMIELFDGALRD